MLVVAVVIFFRLKNTMQQKMKNKFTGDACRSIPHDENIFCMMYSTDGTLEEAIHSIASLYNNAYCPRRIFVGLFLRTDSTEKKRSGWRSDLFVQNVKFYYPTLCSTMATNVRVYRHYTWEDNGSYSFGMNYLQQNLYKQEKYCMTLSTSVRLRKHWDKTIIEHYEDVSPKVSKIIFVEKPLSSTPKGCTSFMCFKEWSEYGTPIVKSIASSKPYASLRKSLFYSSSFSFYRSHPSLPLWDPVYNLPLYVEEWLYYIRLWTNGWDVFTCKESVAFKKSPYSQFTLDCKKSIVDSKRMWIFLGYDKESTLPLEWSIGTVRTLQQFCSWCGVDWLKQKVGKHSFVGMAWHKNLKGYSTSEIVEKYKSESDFHASDQYFLSQEEGIITQV